MELVVVLSNSEGPEGTIGYKENKEDSTYQTQDKSKSFKKLFLKYKYYF